MNKHKVFIFFSSKDTALALKIYDRLNHRGIQIVNLNALINLPM